MESGKHFANKFCICCTQLVSNRLDSTQQIIDNFYAIHEQQMEPSAGVATLAERVWEGRWQFICADKIYKRITQARAGLRDLCVCVCDSEEAG